MALDAEGDVLVPVVVGVALRRGDIGGVRLGQREDRRVVARPDDDLIALALEGRQQGSRGAVRAVLAPEVLEQRGLGRRRLPTELGDHELAVRFGETHSLTWLPSPFECFSICTFVHPDIDLSGHWLL